MLLHEACRAGVDLAVDEKNKKKARQKLIRLKTIRKREVFVSLYYIVELHYQLKNKKEMSVNEDEDEQIVVENAFRCIC